MTSATTPGRPTGERRTRVVLDARVRPGEQGGVEQAIVGLAHGLSALEGPEEYVFVVQGDGAWLAPHVGGSCRIATAAFPDARQQRVIDRASRWGGLAGSATRLLLETGPGVLPRPDPVVEELRPDVIHFLKHRGWRTRTPNIYVPHDLQHIDMPEHFDLPTRTYRRIVYGAMARQATLVAALTEDQRAPLAAHYRLSPDRVVAVPWASVLDAYDVAPEPVEGLPPRFAYLPAKSWPHKRHDLVVEALARLRRDGVDIPVVCTGGRTTGWDRVVDRATALGVDDLLVHLGFVSEGAVRTLYDRAALLLFPSEYEGFGMPVVEAFGTDTPVVCADIGVLRSIADGAAALFASGSADALAVALRQVWTDGEVRDRLAAAGRDRARRYTWSATATAYRHHYRALAGAAPDSRVNP